MHVEGEWILLGCYDNGAGDFTCRHCPKRGIRFEHEIRHKGTGEVIRVGCVCAERLTGDVTGPKLNEAALKARLRRLKVFIAHWRPSAKGNPFRKWDGVAIVLHCSGGRWAFSWNDGQEWHRDPHWFLTELDAKQAAFDFCDGSRLAQPPMSHVNA